MKEVEDRVVVLSEGKVSELAIILQHDALEANRLAAVRELKSCVYRPSGKFCDVPAILGVSYLSTVDLIAQEPSLEVIKELAYSDLMVRDFTYLKPQINIDRETHRCLMLGVLDTVLTKGFRYDRVNFHDAPRETVKHILDIVINNSHMLSSAVDSGLAVNGFVTIACDTVFNSTNLPELYCGQVLELAYLHGHVNDFVNMYKSCPKFLRVDSSCHYVNSEAWRYLLTRYSQPKQLACLLSPTKLDTLLPVAVAGVMEADENDSVWERIGIAASKLEESRVAKIKNLHTLVTESLSVWKKRGSNKLGVSGYNKLFSTVEGLELIKSDW